MSDNDMTPLLWKALNFKEEQVFRESARMTYQVGTNVNMLWHPVYLHECYKMNKEAGILKEA